MNWKKWNKCIKFHNVSIMIAYMTSGPLGHGTDGPPPGKTGVMTKDARVVVGRTGMHGAYLFHRFNTDSGANYRIA